MDRGLSENIGGRDFSTVQAYLYQDVDYPLTSLMIIVRAP